LIQKLTTDYADYTDLFFYHRGQGEKLVTKSKSKINPGEIAEAASHGARMQNAGRERNDKDNYTTVKD
jgi:hypothetical protein